LVSRTAQHVVNGLEVNRYIIDIKTYFSTYEHLCVAATQLLQDFTQALVIHDS
jgi:hypothetical protein